MGAIFGQRSVYWFGVVLYFAPRRHHRLRNVRDKKAAHIPMFGFQGILSKAPILVDLETNGYKIDWGLEYLLGLLAHLLFS